MKILFYLLVITTLFFSCSDKMVDDKVILPGGEMDKNSTDSTFTISYIISPKSDHKHISELIYGIGFYDNENLAFSKSHTNVRFGGNGTTAYNWEINCSNSGTDWYHNNHRSWGKCDAEEGWVASQLREVVDGCLKSNKTPVISLPISYGVAGDADGYVTGDYDKHRWKLLELRKNTIYPDSELSYIPDTTDNYVFLDESVAYLTKKYGAGNIIYSLDNEPELWTGTHHRLMSACAGYEKDQKLECWKFLDRTIEAAKVIKEIDKDAITYGFVSYGIAGYLSFQGAPDWDNDLRNKYDWFIDYFLERTKKASDECGKRLVDVLDFHAYPSEIGDNPINKIGVKSTPRDMKVRLQAPRRFWDPEYAKVFDPEVHQWAEWVILWNQKFLPILPPMLRSIEKYNPGTKLAITEFQIGGYDDISGTIALADILGIYGKYGVYAANHWGKPGYNGFLAYDMFRDYDGHGGTFGNTYVKAETKNPNADKMETSVYASIHDEDIKQLHIIVLNKNMEKKLKGEFRIEDTDYNYTSAEIYYVKGLSEADKSLGLMEEIKKDNVKIEIKDNKFTYIMPKLSVAHVILKKN